MDEVCGVDLFRGPFTPILTHLGHILGGQPRYYQFLLITDKERQTECASQRLKSELLRFYSC